MYPGNCHRLEANMGVFWKIGKIGKKAMFWKAFHEQIEMFGKTFHEQWKMWEKHLMNNGNIAQQSSSWKMEMLGKAVQMLVKPYKTIEILGKAFNEERTCLENHFMNNGNVGKSNSLTMQILGKAVQWKCWEIFK